MEKIYSYRIGRSQSGNGNGIHGTDGNVNSSGRGTYDKPAVIGWGIPKTPLVGMDTTNLTGMEGNSEEPVIAVHLRIVITETQSESVAFESLFRWYRSWNLVTN
jgi:hypothetical protein